MLDISLDGGMEDGALPLLNGHLKKAKGTEEGKGKDGEMRSKTSGTKPIGMQMQGKGNSGDTMLMSSSGLTMAEKEEEDIMRITEKLLTLNIVRKFTENSGS